MIQPGEKAAAAAVRAAWDAYAAHSMAVSTADDAHAAADQIDPKHVTAATLSATADAFSTAADFATADAAAARRTAGAFIRAASVCGRADRST